MEDGQRVTTNPQAVLTALYNKREKLHEELRMVEKQVYDLETTYLQDSSQCGNVLKGFEGFLSSTKNTANLKRSRKFQPEDRLFSLSSVTSPAVEEHAVARDDQFCSECKDYDPSVMRVLEAVIQDIKMLEPITLEKESTGITDAIIPTFILVIVHLI